MKSLRLLTRPAAGLPRTAVILSTGFFFVFMGASAFQQFRIPYLTDKGVTSAFQAFTILALVYISFLVWRAVGCVYPLLSGRVLEHGFRRYDVFPLCPCRLYVESL